MRFSVDHDFHIHSRLSRCSGDAAQTPEAMLYYAARFGLKKICVTDHFWDARVPGANAWYRGQDLDHLRSILPLPEGEIRFCFGAETEMDRSFRLGIAPQTFDAFDFVIIPAPSIVRRITLNTSSSFWTFRKATNLTLNREKASAKRRGFFMSLRGNRRRRCSSFQSSFQDGCP